MDYDRIWIDEAEHLPDWWSTPHITPPPMAIAECLMHLYPPVAPSLAIRFSGAEGTATAFGGRHSGKTITNGLTSSRRPTWCRPAKRRLPTASAIAPRR